MNAIKLSIKVLFLVTLSVFFLSSKLFSQESKVLMTIADEVVTVDDFLSVYYKNNIKGEPIDKKTLSEYAELFINFKLKVKEAEALGLDTVEVFNKELAGYRTQLAQSLLTNKEVTETLIKEAYERMQTDIRASHILIRIDQNATPADTLKAYNKIMNLRNQIMKGRSFAAVAVESSEDHSARDSEGSDMRPPMKGNAGDLGYFTALDMVYPFENGAYNTKIGEVSMPVRTSFGYHLIKVTDRKPAMGRVQVAHILKALPSNATEKMAAEKHEEIKAIYEKLIQGDVFEDLAKNFSDDKGSGTKGGLLPWFGVNRMVPEFIEQIAQLENINDFSKPFRTNYGYHIVQLIDKKDVESFEVLYPELKNRVSRDQRSNLSKELFIKQIKKEYKFTENRKTIQDFYKVVDDSVFYGKWQIEKAEKLKKELFKIGEKSYTQKDFADFIFNRQGPRTKENIEVFVNAMYNTFVDEACIAYEDSKLEEKNPEFKALMKEYRDGILLFELTDQKVWSKAIRDTSGIEEFYKTISHNYLWPKRINATIFTCQDEKIAKKTRKMVLNAQKRDLPNQEVYDKINKKNKSAMAMESDFFAKGDNAIIDAVEWEEGISGNIKNGNDVVFVVVHEIINPEPKNLSDVRGLVTAEYQNYLEQEWIKELRNKYPVKLNKDVLYSIK